MKTMLKQSVGIDVAQDDFVASFGRYLSDFDAEIVSTKTFTNSPQGFKELASWVNKMASKELVIHYVMEATGVYHERLACFLHDAGCVVSVVLPQRAKSFSKTLTGKTVTDKEASKSLTVMGLEKKLDAWQKPDDVYRQLKQLTREREQLQKQRTEVANELHAEQAGAWPHQPAIKRMRKRAQVLEKQIADIEREIKSVLDAHPELRKKIDRLTTAPGIGLITAVTLVGETNGFNLMRNKRQLVSYAGYDVVEKQSGTSVRGKARISHRGNRHIRRAMHFPALTAARLSPTHREQYKRLVSKHGIKMKAAVAIQRKLLVLVYALWKKNEHYDALYCPYQALAEKMRKKIQTNDSLCCQDHILVEKKGLQINSEAPTELVLDRSLT